MANDEEGMGRTTTGMAMQQCHDAPRHTATLKVKRKLVPTFNVHISSIF